MKTKLYALIGRILTLLAFVLAVLLATGVHAQAFVSSSTSATTSQGQPLTIWQSAS